MAYTQVSLPILLPQMRLSWPNNHDLGDQAQFTLNIRFQCLGLGTAMAWGSIPGWGTKILQQAAWPKKLNKHKKCLNYFPESVQ